MTVRTSLVLAAALLVTAVLLAPSGCGQNTVDFFSASRQNMESSNSFRITGNMEMVISMSEDGSNAPLELNIPMEEEIEQDGGAFNMKALVGVGGSMEDGENLMTMYLLDGQQLYYQSLGKWYRSDFATPLTAMGGGNNQLITPDSILRMLDSADEIEVVRETEDDITYHFTLGDIYYQEALEQFKEIMPDYPLEQYENLVRAMEYELELTVDKNTEQVSRLNVDMVGNDLEFTEGYKMSMKMSGFFEFSGYGEDFDIELPEEARDAEYIDTSRVSPF